MWFSYPSLVTDLKKKKGKDHGMNRVTVSRHLPQVMSCRCKTFWSTMRRRVLLISQIPLDHYVNFRLLTVYPLHIHLDFIHSYPYQDRIYQIARLVLLLLLLLEIGFQSHRTSILTDQLEIPYTFYFSFYCNTNRGPLDFFFSLCTFVLYTNILLISTFSLSLSISLL
jgi:hypothetical protein